MEQTQQPDDAAEPDRPRGEPGDPRVTAALDRLTGLDQRPVDEHVAVYDAVHRDLRDALADDPTDSPDALLADGLADGLADSPDALLADGLAEDPIDGSAEETTDQA